ncbi:hypothetical protein HDA32_000779 [Spinactinospora alkalitolerans]|uniref:Uncharacterized protein n=1 Tax=Spinactinospora alkalitolerans TaxID=687207 RepID=A0A852TNV6_9ACTN|nr:hypothetical protein [Spinactinospora alkalitolerans]NYE45659.1 hypothetical protein [Spinactinospora alkalitolerans]
MSSVPLSRLSAGFSPLNPLFVLAKELEARGLHVSVDASISVVDAHLTGDFTASGHRSGDFQRAILRVDAVTAHPWWWLLWPGERFKNEVAEPEVTRLLPVEQTPDVARRIRNVLILGDSEPPGGSAR